MATGGYMSAAQAIHEHVSARLRAQDERATYRAVAALVDEHPTAWGRWVRGEVVPSADRVHAWCMRAGVAIYTVGRGWECDEPSPWDKRPLLAAEPEERDSATPLKAGG